MPQKHRKQNLFFFVVVVVNSTVELTFSYCVSYHRSNWFSIAFGPVLCRSISLSIDGFRPAIFFFFPRGETLKTVLFLKVFRPSRNSEKCAAMQMALSECFLKHSLVSCSTVPGLEVSTGKKNLSMAECRLQPGASRILS